MWFFAYTRFNSVPEMRSIGVPETPILQYTRAQSSIIPENWGLGQERGSGSEVTVDYSNPIIHLRSPLGSDLESEGSGVGVTSSNDPASVFHLTDRIFDGGWLHGASSLKIWCQCQLVSMSSLRRFVSGWLTGFDHARDGAR